MVDREFVYIVGSLGNPGRLFGAFWETSGDLLGSLEQLLTSLWPSLGALWDHLAPFGCLLGSPGSFLEFSLKGAVSGDLANAEVW